jgi:hypothetical protein
MRKNGSKKSLKSLGSRFFKESSSTIKSRRRVEDNLKFYDLRMMIIDGKFNSNENKQKNRYTSRKAMDSEGS